jgi:CopG antitoxin of type II toxin-antitoxin system
MKTISAEERDRKFDDGEDISLYLDWSKATRANLELTHVGLDLPVGVLRKLDAEAKRLGVSRQSLMQQWIMDRLSAVEQG